MGSLQSHKNQIHVKVFWMVKSPPVCFAEVKEEDKEEEKMDTSGYESV